MELGTSSGFELELMDRGGKGHAALLKAKDALLESAAKSTAVTSVRYSGMADTEQYDLVIDNSKAGAYGLSRAEINSAISAYWAGEYINDFSDKGRTKKVYLQAEPRFAPGRVISADTTCATARTRWCRSPVLSALSPFWLPQV